MMFYIKILKFQTFLKPYLFHFTNKNKEKWE